MEKYLYYVLYMCGPEGDYLVDRKVRAGRQCYVDRKIRAGRRCYVDRKIRAGRQSSVDRKIRAGRRYYVDRKIRAGRRMCVRYIGELTKLRAYVLTVTRDGNGSIVHTEERVVFWRILVFYHNENETICFLKGICKGELLAAVGRDANNNMFPLAWAVVTVENKETWEWFLDLLMHDIDRGNGNGLTLISDGHKERVPHAEHRLCARHILANFNSRLPKQRHEAAMQEIKELDMGHLIISWRWTLNVIAGLFKKKEYFVMPWKMEFHRVLIHKPIIAMLVDIRVYVMQRLYHQRSKGESWDLTICPRIRKKIVDLKEKQRYAVDLIRRTCGCGRWQLTGVPCVHGVAAISSLNLNSEEYIASYYTLYRYKVSTPSLYPQRVEGYLVGHLLRGGKVQQKGRYQAHTHSIKSKAGAKVFNMLC
uniref:SWIM-type domain-containing protein n=1 Tax=Lactuca sativa TaxID=4236 RepID=A0A9R1XFE8_LACSA|nr:hypothetical protein LSAT_V11C400209100 [Lactuca sativa]